MSHQKLTRKKVEAAIENSLGNKSLVAKRCGVTWQGIYHFFKRYPDLNEKLERERHNIVYVAEQRLLQMITQGDLKDKTTFDAVNKVLNNQGKFRGWGDKQEIISKNLNVNVENDQLKEILGKIRDGRGL